MIKIITGEEPEFKQPERTIRFQFRKHAQAGVTKAVENIAFLVATEDDRDLMTFPIKVDGETKEFTVRRRIIVELGFKLVVIDG